MTFSEHLALFGAGIASFLAPCVVPLVPAYLGMMVGETTGVPRSVVRAGLTFVAGFASVFVALGALAGRLGSGLTSAQTWLERAGGILVVGFGLVLLGVLRGGVFAERRLISGVAAGGNVARPLVMGVAFGAAWTPCVGPLLGAALVLAARSAQPLHGASLLLAYALGIGVPFVAGSLAVASSPSLLARMRRMSSRVERIAGVALVLLGLLLASGTYARLVGPVARLAPGST